MERMEGERRGGEVARERRDVVEKLHPAHCTSRRGGRSRRRRRMRRREEKRRREEDVEEEGGGERVADARGEFLESSGRRK